MTDNVTDLFEKPGNETFIICPCTENGTPVTPVVLHDQQGPIITSLMCPECETTIPVANGILQMERGS